MSLRLGNKTLALKFTLKLSIMKFPHSPLHSPLLFSLSSLAWCMCVGGWDCCSCILFTFKQLFDGRWMTGIFYCCVRTDLGFLIGVVVFSVIVDILHNFFDRIGTLNECEYICINIYHSVFCIFTLRSFFAIFCRSFCHPSIHQPISPSPHSACSLVFKVQSQSVL